MTTITIDEQTKAGKTLLELAKILAVSNKGIVIETTESKEIKKGDTTTPSGEFDLDESLGLK